jgi:hypothetical protein
MNRLRTCLDTRASVAAMRGACVSALALLAVTLGSAGCSSDDKVATAPTTESAPQADAQNACPVDGCQIKITDVTVEGQELKVVWSANFDPDFSKNHIHVYWDNYTAAQVSNDAAAKGQTQGEWVPTDDYPAYVTEGPVSTDVRGNSTHVCVTAGDRDHNVIDSSITDCYDVSALL